MLQFREHAYQTNDIFLVAAQAIANSLVRASDALPAGTHLRAQLRRACIVLGILGHLICVAGSCINGDEAEGVTTARLLHG